MIETAEALRVSVLGPLQVADGAGRPVPVGGYRLRALLILLALEAGRPVAARSLIGRLWPDDPPAGAANALQSLVSRLRVALRQAGCDAAIESTQAGYRLAVRPEAVDALAFEAAARAGARALGAGDPVTAARLLRGALAAWRGPALSDVAEEEFAAAPAARLAELRATAQLDRIEADLALGDATAVVGELRALTAADPLAERPAALLMRALAAAGRQSEALSAYARVRARLADQLGIDPSLQLEQTYLAILRQEGPAAGGAAGARPPVPGGAADGDTERVRQAPSPPGSPHGGRRPPTSFIGRDDDLARVVKRLATDRLVTLAGSGGVGKTRLAAEVAACLGKPAWFVELAPVTNPADVPYAVLDALGLRERSISRHSADPAAATDPVARIAGALADRDDVLILDNCEHVIDDTARLADHLIGACPRVRVLATSREPLRIPGEALHPVTPLPVPPVSVPAASPSQSESPAAPSGMPDSKSESGIPEISTYAAVRLFADRAAAVLPDFELNHGNVTAIAQICRVLDGLPLAIELAAPWLRTLTPRQLADRLDDRFTLLTAGSRTALPRHQTLRAVVEWSWHLLSDPERCLARRLAVFPAGATLAAAEAVCAGTAPGGDGLARADVLPALSGLVAKSIITRAPDGRYRMLETVRAYGLERLAEAGEDTTAMNAMAAYYLDLAETADPKLRTADQVRWFRELSAEQDNLHAAVRHAIASRDADTALRFVRALGYYWVQRRHGEGEALARAVLGLDPPPPGKRVAEGRVICALLAASLSWDINSVRGALSEALDALEPWASGDADVHPLAVIAKPLLFTFNGDQERAMDSYQEFVRSGDPWQRGMGLLYRASQATTLGRFEGAEDDCRAAIREFRLIGERWGTALALTQLVDFTEARADHQASIDALAEAGAIGRDLGTWGDLSYVEAKLAVIRARAGQVARGSAELAEVERAMAARGGTVDTDRWVVSMRAEISWLSGDLPGAVAACTALLAAIESNEAAWWQSLRAQVRSRLAMALLALGDRAACERQLAAALDSAAAWPEHQALAVVLDAHAAYAVTPVADAPVGDAPVADAPVADAPVADAQPPSALRAGQPPSAGHHASLAGDAGLAARLLGAAFAIRGTFDESSLDAPRARAAARQALGDEAYQAAFREGRSHSYEGAINLAREHLGAAPPRTAR